MDEQELDGRLSHASLQALRSSYDLNTSVTAYYMHYLGKLAHGDLGYSQTLGAPVRDLLEERMPETIRSVAEGLLFAWALGLALAIATVMARRLAVELFTSFCAGVLLCVPAAMLALLIVVIHAPGRLVIGLIVFPKIFYYAWNLLEQSASKPHVFHAWAKGLSRTRVLVRHILQPVLPQLLALAGVSVSMAFASAIPVEVVCDSPGVGQLAWKAAMGRDVNLLVNLTVIVTAITLLANSGASHSSIKSKLREV